jgi:hypothetical protein
MSHEAMLVLIAVGSFCIWMATHPSPPRTRRSDPRARRDAEQESDEPDDSARSRLRRNEEYEWDVARVRFQAAGRNRWDRRDLHHGIGRDSTIDEPENLVWPQERRTLIPKLR